MGDMSTSPGDPLFYCLHAMVDRLWYQWQQDSSNPDITQEVSESSLSYGSSVSRMSIAGVLNVASLGYNYLREGDPSGFAQPAPKPQPLAGGARRDQRDWVQPGQNRRRQEQRRRTDDRRWGRRR